MVGQEITKDSKSSFSPSQSPVYIKNKAGNFLSISRRSTPLFLQKTIKNLLLI